MMNLLKGLWREEEGQGMVEYGLILALVSVVAIGALLVMGDTIFDQFNEVIKGLGGTPATK